MSLVSGILHYICLFIFANARYHKMGNCTHRQVLHCIYSTLESQLHHILEYMSLHVAGYLVMLVCMSCLSCVKVPLCGPWSPHQSEQGCCVGRLPCASRCESVAHCTALQHCVCTCVPCGACWLRQSWIVTPFLWLSYTEFCAAVHTGYHVLVIQ